MAAFLENITPFIGTGEKNEDGLTLEEFLEKYNARKYETPSVTTDLLVFQYPKVWNGPQQGMKLLMIKRRNHPSIGMWALPGGFANMREDLKDSAKRELREETGLEGIAIEQLYTWGNYARDPRWRIVTVSFLALIEEENIEVKAGDDAKDAKWMDVTFCQMGLEEDWIVDGKEKKKKIYQLLLENKEQNIKLTAKVALIQNKNGMLKEETYEVIENNGIAFDHPAMIVQACVSLE